MADFSDCRTILERALAAPNGLRVEFASPAEATRFRMRCNQARKEDRKIAQAIHEAGTPGHGRSQFDGLVLRLRENVVIFEFEKPAEMLKVEEF